MRSVLISGASVAGPALAYWLGRHGFRPTVVEQAPALRGGGYAVDFRGEAHLTVLERTGILAELRALQTGGTPMTFVDEAGGTLLRLPGEFAGGDLEVLRSDLARVLHDRSRDWTEYVFGDAVATLAETGGGVDVTFTSGAARTFDLVVGADGMHSGVRRIAFGPHARFVRHLGYSVAGWDLPAGDGLGADTLAYNAPGRLASIGRHPRDEGRASAFMVFASRLRAVDPRDTELQKWLIADAYAGLGWRVPELLASLEQAEDLYFDAISRVDLAPWSRGRIALVGDAACGATLGGMGTGTALVAAYVLAGELARGGDAFARYEAAVGDYARRCQKGGDRTGRFLAPRRRLGARLRNRALGTPFLLRRMLEEGRKMPGRIELPDYAPAGHSGRRIDITTSDS